MPTTKASRQDHLRAIARLVSQCRLNAGDAVVARRASEAAAWRDLEYALQGLADCTRAVGLPRQQALFGRDFTDSANGG